VNTYAVPGIPQQEVPMKCAACGYERNVHVVGEDQPVNPDGPKFRRIEGVRFVVEPENPGYGESERRVALYACPECSTVRMEEVW